MSQQSKDTKTRVDEKSGYSLINLSFILNRLVPSRHVNAANRLETRQIISRELLKDFPNNAHIYHELTGPTFEGCVMPPCFDYTKDVLYPLAFDTVRNQVAEIALANGDWIEDVQRKLSLNKPGFDWIIVAAEKNVGHETSEKGIYNRFLLDCKDTYPGYTRLKIANPATTDDNLKLKLKPKSGDFYLSSTALKDDINDNLIQKKAFIGKSLSKYRLDLGGIEQYIEEMNSTDVIIALPCLTWPRVAQNWVTRKRPCVWPSKAHIEQITGKGIFIIPGSHSSSGKPDMEWKLDFSMAERTLLLSFNNVSRQALILLYMIIYNSLHQKPYLIGNLHVKTVLYWVMEEIPQSEWTVENLSYCFLACVDKMIEFISNGNFHHYFIENCNIIDHLKSSDRKQMLKILKEMRKDPVEKLLEFTEDYQLMYLPYTIDMKQVLSKLLIRHKTGKDEALIGWKLKHLEVLNLLALQFMKEHAYNEAIEIYTTYTAQLNIGSRAQVEPVGNIMTAVNSIQYEKLHRITVFDLLLKKFPDSKHRVEMLEALAYEYIVLYYKESDRFKKQECQEKADELFSCAVTIPTCAMNIKVAYAYFLYRFHENQLAIDLLENLLAENDDSLPESSNAYTQPYIQCLDSDLQKLMGDNERIVFPSLALAHYILTRSHFNMGVHKRDQAEVCLVKFKLVCDEEYENFKNQFAGVVVGDTLYLLGIAAKALGQEQMAGESFAKAKELISCSSK